MENIQRMAKKDQKKRDIILSQDNALTTARYKFDLIEKRALYCIIRNIRANYIEREDGQRTLFENLIITIKELNPRGIRQSDRSAAGSNLPN